MSAFTRAAALPFVLAAIAACGDDPAASDVTETSDVADTPDTPDTSDSSDTSAPLDGDAGDDDTGVADGADTSPSDTGPADVVHGRALTRFDVSVLFPLPSGPPAPDLWPASLPARGGALVPEATFDDIARSVTNALEDDREYEALRVVAVRFDPCFRLTIGGACTPQVRLVLQFLGPGEVFDGAVHALYNVAPGELPALVHDLRTLAELAPDNGVDAPLGPSPALIAQGLDGPYGRGLRDIVVAACGPDTLARLTFMTRTNARSGQWEFGGHHLGSWPGFPAAGPIDMLGNPGVAIQMVSRRVGPGFAFTVAPEFIDQAGRAGVDSAALEAAPADVRAAVHAWAVRQQSPDVLTADTSDCASCHLAGHIANAIERTAPALVTPELAAARGPRIRGGAEDNGDNLRAFGYFGLAPHVSQRVANETEAAVAGFAAIP